MSDAGDVEDEDEEGEEGEGEEEGEEAAEDAAGKAAVAGVKEAVKEKQKAPRAAPAFVIELEEPGDPEEGENQEGKDASKEGKDAEPQKQEPPPPEESDRKKKRDRKKKGEAGKEEEVPEPPPEESKPKKQGEWGEVKKESDAEFYLTLGCERPEGFISEAGVILMPDLWGWNDGRTRAIADYLAKSLDAYVAVPKLLCDPPFEDGTDGDGLPQNFDVEGRPAELKQWLMGYLWESFESKVKSVAAHLNTTCKVKRIGGVGFGFGAWTIGYTTVTCGDMVATVLAYPLTHYLEELMGGDIYVMAQRIRCPALFLLAANDDSTYFPGGEFHDIVMLRHPESHLEAFKSMRRLWVVRGDAADLEIREAAEQAVTLLQRYLRKFIWPPPEGRDASALRLACAENDSDFVAALLNEDIPVTGRDAVDVVGLCPIHYAAKAGCMQPIRLLMNAEADVNVAGGASSEMPLHLAVQSGRGKAAGLLLSLKADIEGRDAGSQTPLHHAAIKGHAMVMNLLLKNKAEMHALDTAGQTPLHLAAWKGKGDVVIILLKRKADIDLEDLRGQTPYQRAVQGGSELVKDMLEVEKEHRELEAFYEANPSMRPVKDAGQAAAAMPFVQMEKRTFIPMADI